MHMKHQTIKTPYLRPQSLPVQLGTEGMLAASDHIEVKPNIDVDDSDKSNALEPHWSSWEEEEF